MSVTDVCFARTATLGSDAYQLSPEQKKRIGHSVCERRNLFEKEFASSALTFSFAAWRYLHSPHFPLQSRLGEFQDRSQVAKKVGERGRNRTYNLLIKSQLLCQLSYAPGRITEGGTTFDYNIGDERFRRWSPVINWNLPQIYSLVK